MSFALSEVLVISHLYPRPGNPVAGRFIADEITALSKLGLLVEILVPTPWTPLGGMGSSRWISFASTPSSWVVESTTAHRVQYLAIPKVKVPMLDTGTLAISLLLKSRKYKTRNIVIHAHTLFPDGVAGALAFNNRSPLVISVHGADVRLGTKSEWIQRKTIGRWALRRAQTIVANSSRTKNRICDIFRVNPDRIVVVPPGVASSRIDVVPVADPVGLGKPEIVAVGNLVPLKGHKDLLRALGSEKLKSSEWKLSVIGDGPERKRLEQMASFLGIEDRVVFLGRLEPNEVPKYLSRAQVFALPSSDEAWGVAWAEAQYLGLPAIACRGQGTEEIIHDNETGYLVSPGDIDELIDRLQRLLTNPSLRLRMGALARVKARGLDVDEVGHRLLSIYKTVAGMHSAHRI